MLIFLKSRVYRHSRPKANTSFNNEKSTLGYDILKDFANSLSLAVERDIPIYVAIVRRRGAATKIESVDYQKAGEAGSLKQVHKKILGFFFKLQKKKKRFEVRKIFYVVSSGVVLKIYVFVK